MLDSTKPEQPSLMAIALCQKHLTLKDQCFTFRAMAAQLRRDAKVAPIKADAFAMKAKAKELSAQAAAAKKDSEKAHKDFVEQAGFAHKLLSQRMPPQWTQWGVVKTRAYTSLIDVIATQLQRVHVNAVITANALQHLTEYESWADHLMGQLATLKPTSKEIPE